MRKDRSIFQERDMPVEGYPHKLFDVAWHLVFAYCPMGKRRAVVEGCYMPVCRSCRAARCHNPSGGLE